MKISTRKRFGIALIGFALIGWVSLIFWCISHGRVLESRSSSETVGSFSVTVRAQSVQMPAWTFFTLAGIVGLGIVLIVMPSRKQTDA